MEKNKRKRQEEQKKNEEYKIICIHGDAVQVFLQVSLFVWDSSESELTYHCSKHVSLIFLLQQEQDV